MDFRPKISDRRPYNGWQAVDVKRYEVPTHDDIDAAWNVRPSVGRAVDTLPPSQWRLLGLGFAEWYVLTSFDLITNL